MKSKVYFIAVNNSDDLQSVTHVLKKLIAQSGVLGFIQEGQTVAVKMHFGEEGASAFVNPAYVRIICDEITKSTAHVFLSDANTLYRGRRFDSGDHAKLAAEHGFTKASMGAKVIIPDDTKKENEIDMPICKKLITSAKIARIFIDAGALVAVSHFKGHCLTGFGGAIKNIGMGCATKAGKLAQHCDVAPIAYAKKCVGCAECEKVCPTGAIHLENNKACVNKEKCIGCASCIVACRAMALCVDFMAGDEVQEKMAEYAFAVLKEKKNKAGFINFAVKINKECDCWGMENPRIAPDVGIFASLDPVSIDKASYDLVNGACGKDIFKEVHPGHDGLTQLTHAQELGLGNLEYELCEIK